MSPLRSLKSFQLPIALVLTAHDNLGQVLLVSTYRGTARSGLRGAAQSSVVRPQAWEDGKAEEEGVWIWVIGLECPLPEGPTNLPPPPAEL